MSKFLQYFFSVNVFIFCHIQYTKSSAICIDPLLCVCVVYTNVLAISVYGNVGVCIYIAPKAWICHMSTGLKLDYKLAMRVRAEANMILTVTVNRNQRISPERCHHHQQQPSVSSYTYYVRRCTLLNITAIKRVNTEDCKEFNETDLVCNIICGDFEYKYYVHV